MEERVTVSLFLTGYKSLRRVGAHSSCWNLDFQASVGLGSRRTCMAGDGEWPLSTPLHPIGVWCLRGFAVARLSLYICCLHSLVILTLWWHIHNLELPCLIDFTWVPLGFFCERMCRFLNAVHLLWPHINHHLCVCLAETKLLTANAPPHHNVFDIFLINVIFKKVCRICHWQLSHFIKFTFLCSLMYSF